MGHSPSPSPMPRARSWNRNASPSPFPPSPQLQLLTAGTSGDGDGHWTGHWTLRVESTPSSALQTNSLSRARQPIAITFWEQERSPSPSNLKQLDSSSLQRFDRLIEDLRRAAPLPPPCTRLSVLATPETGGVEKSATTSLLELASPPSASPPLPESTAPPQSSGGTISPLKVNLAAFPPLLLPPPQFPSLNQKDLARRALRVLLCFASSPKQQASHRAHLRARLLRQRHGTAAACVSGASSASVSISIASASGATRNALALLLTSRRYPLVARTRTRWRSRVRQ